MASTDRRLHWMNVLFPGDIDFPGNSEGLIVPSGPISSRPVTPTNGIIRYSTSDLVLEAYVDGSWENIGNNTFIGSTDTPLTYTGLGNSLLRVNSAEDAVEAYDIGTGFLPNAGGTMDIGANITMDNGEVLGLPVMPSVGDAAASKDYVDNEISTVLTTQSWSGNLSPDGGGTGDRVESITYSNGTVSNMVVTIIVFEATIATLKVDSIPLSSFNIGAASPVGTQYTHTITVPPGSTYQFTFVGATFYTWYELSV